MVCGWVLWGHATKALRRPDQIRPTNHFRW